MTRLTSKETGSLPRILSVSRRVCSVCKEEFSAHVTDHRGRREEFTIHEHAQEMGLVKFPEGFKQVLL